MSFRKSRIAAICAGTAIVLVGVAGCGGSDDSSGDALSKEDYIAQADAICAEADATSKSNETEFVTAFQAGDYEAAGDTIEKNQEAIKGSIDELKALVPPEEDQATLDEMYALADQQSALVPDLVDAVRAGDTAALKEVGKKGDALNEQINAIADEYGMVDCGSAGDA